MFLWKVLSHYMSFIVSKHHQLVVGGAQEKEHHPPRGALTSVYSWGGSAVSCLWTARRS